MLLVVLTVLLALPQTLQARWYDAEAGRWLTRDPAGYIDGPNAVEYVASAPIARSDPMGLAMGTFGASTPPDLRQTLSTATLAA
jgi:uncharacterized protein RhaS with RHS repeats